MKMSVGVMVPNTPFQDNNNNKSAGVDLEELAKLDETLNMLAQVSLSLRTASNLSHSGSIRRKKSARRRPWEKETTTSPGYETIPRNFGCTTTAPFSYTHGPVSFAKNNNAPHYATIVRVPRRNSGSKITKLTRHRPHLKGKPKRPEYPADSTRPGYNNQHANGGPGYPRGMPAVPPKQKIMTPEELTIHEAQEKLKMKQMEEAMLQQTLNQQQKQAEENARWLEQEEQMLSPDANPEDSPLRRGRGSNNSLTDSKGNMMAPPPPSVPPSKPKRKMSRPKDEQAAGPPQTKLEEVKTAPTMQLNRDDDAVYKNTMEVVKAVLGMNNMTMNAKPDELFASVKTVGAALKQLCASLDEVLPGLPEDFHREIDMAQRTTNKDLSQVINQLKLVQRFYTTTQVVDYKKCLMAANQVLAIDAKNLLDVVDRARIRKIQEAQEQAKAQVNDIRHGAVPQASASGYEPEELYPDGDFL